MALDHQSKVWVLDGICHCLQFLLHTKIKVKRHGYM